MSLASLFSVPLLPSLPPLSFFADSNITSVIPFKRHYDLSLVFENNSTKPGIIHTKCINILIPAGGSLKVQT